MSVNRFSAADPFASEPLSFSADPAPAPVPVSFAPTPAASSALVVKKDNALSWSEKDRFVRINGMYRHNPKAEAAAVGGAGLALGTTFAGICVATAGAAAPLFFGGLALAAASGVTLGRLGKSKPDGLRKHVFSDYDNEISRKESAAIVADLKASGLYQSGRSRTLLQTENVQQAVEVNPHVPAHKRDSITSLLKFHGEDVAWRAAVADCKRIYKADFKANKRPSRKKQDIDPTAYDRFIYTREVRSKLKTLKYALPSQREAQRGWLEEARAYATDPDKQVAYDNLLASLDRLAR